MALEQKKILFISSFTLPDTAGSGIHAFRFARFIIRQGDKASVLTFNRNLKYRYSETIDNVPIIRIPYFNKGILLKIFSLPLIITWYIINILKNKIVLIYGGKIIAYEIAILIAKIFGKKVVFRSLLFGVDDFNQLINARSRIQGFLTKFVMDKIDLYYSINSAFTKSYLNYYSLKDRLLEMPQGVDTEYFNITDAGLKKQYRKELGLPEDAVILLSVGFLIMRKGYLSIFEALSKLTTPIIYLIIGEYQFSKTHFLSNYKKEANEIVERGQLLLGERVKFLGSILNIEKYYKLSDILIHHSDNEIPNVMYEAMACGLPTIVYKDNEITNSTLNPGSNYIQLDEESKISLILKDLIANEKKRHILGVEANKSILRNARFELIYNTLLEKLLKTKY